MVRGATGLVTGTGEPSGTMNFVRKRPGDEMRTSITGSKGSRADYRGELDIGGPLNEAGTSLEVSADGSALFVTVKAPHEASHPDYRKGAMDCVVRLDLAKLPGLSD